MRHGVPNGLFRRRSPVTGERLAHKHLTPNHTLRSDINEWRDARDRAERLPATVFNLLEPHGVADLPPPVPASKPRRRGGKKGAAR